MADSQAKSYPELDTVRPTPWPAAADEQPELAFGDGDDHDGLVGEAPRLWATGSEDGEEQDETKKDSE